MLSNWMSICLYQYLKVGSTGLAGGQGWGGTFPIASGPEAPGGGVVSRPPEAERPTLLQDSAGEPLYKLFKAIKHQVEKGPVDAVQKKAKYTLNDTGLLGDDVEYAPLVSPAGWLSAADWPPGPRWREAPSAVAPTCCRTGGAGPLRGCVLACAVCCEGVTSAPPPRPAEPGPPGRRGRVGEGVCGRSSPPSGPSSHVRPQTVNVIVQDEGADAIPVKVLNCDTISQVKEKIIDQVYRTQPCSRWPKADSVVLGECGPLVPRWAGGWGAAQGALPGALWPGPRSSAVSPRRVAPWVHRPDPVGPGPDVPAGGPVETHQHPHALQRECGRPGARLPVG